MRHVKFLLLISLTLLAMGCAREKSPSQVFSEYNAKVIEGIDYEADKAYYSKRKQADVESKLPQYMERMSKSREEAIRFYLDFSRSVAKCKEIHLVNEAIEGNTARLEYSQKDVCGNESTSPEKQTVKMIKEDGWKIDDIEISL